MHSFIIPILLNLGLGALLGFAGGMLGIGGGLIAIPLLGYFYGMNQHLAQGTALVMIAPNVLIGFLRYRQRHHFELRGVMLMCLFSTLAAWLAAKMATGMDAHQLRLAFAVFLVVLAVYFGLRRSQASGANHGDSRHVPPVALPLLGLASGAMSGIFTVGGGLVVVPVLVKIFKMAQARAQGIALALVIPGALVALGTYARAGNVSWSTGLPLAAGGVLTVSTGVALAHRFTEPALRVLFSLVLLGTALLMFIPS